MLTGQNSCSIDTDDSRGVEFSGFVKPEYFLINRTKGELCNTGVLLHVLSYCHGIYLPYMTEEIYESQPLLRGQ
jgi:hypothetical protein